MAVSIQKEEVGDTKGTLGYLGWLRMRGGPGARRRRSRPSEVLYFALVARGCFLGGNAFCAKQPLRRLCAGLRLSPFLVQGDHFASRTIVETRKYETIVSYVEKSTYLVPGVAGSLFDVVYAKKFFGKCRL